MPTLSLRDLECNGLVTRTVHPDAPPRVEYADIPLIDSIRWPPRVTRTTAAPRRGRAAPGSRCSRSGRRRTSGTRPAPG
ncbi:winged helix-turn-helix transcriptional regulator [Streptomyces sp. NPDC049879]|uniref:winged helix-turn-helix transcriptional regulator n=1 Tax=Streptomyces sp. NPDC049879 TaxID=3365598 RepID=UPI003788A639